MCYTRYEGPFARAAPDAVAGVVRRATAANSDERFASAEELRDALHHSIVPHDIPCGPSLLPVLAVIAALLLLALCLVLMPGG
ncbi:MAG: hypothetical protein OHK0022_03520 [Roseiflexaceae bacterium]